jgi:vitamin B12 transporter
MRAFLIICLYSFQYSQIIYVFDSDSSSISDFKITSSDSSEYFFSYSFDLNQIDLKSPIKISHIAYQTIRIHLDTISTIIILNPKHYLCDIENVDEISNASFERIVLNDQKNIASNRQLLNKITQINLSNFGGDGALSELKFNGLSGHHTAVLIEGFRINNAQNNTFNISTLNINSFDQIDVYGQGSNILHSGDAIGGSVNLVSKLNQKHFISFSTGIGSYSSAFQSLSFQKSSSYGSFKMVHNRSESSNYFPYYKSLTNTAYRNHSDYRKNNTLITFTSPISNHILFKSYALHSYLNAGTPGSKRDLNLNFEPGKLRQVDNDNVYLFTVNYNANVHHNVQFGYIINFSKLKYNESSIYKNLNQTVRVSHDYLMNSILTLHHQLEYKTYALDGFTGLEKIDAVRNITSATSQIKMELKPIILRTTLRTEYFHSQEVPLLLSTEATYYLNDRFLLTYNYSNQYRIPTFNELYWPSTGNLKLKPEQSILRTISAQFLSEFFRVKLNIYYNSYWDFIEWYNNEQSQLSVRNVQSYDHRGALISIGIKILSLHNLDLSYSFNEFKSNQAIRYYSPNHILSINSENTFSSFIISQQYRFTSDYVIPNNVMKGPIRHQWDVQISYEYDVNTFVVQPFIKFNNVLNILSKPHIPYPVPNRNTHVGIGIKYNFNKEF